jgi:hypothetical protein
MLSRFQPMIARGVPGTCRSAVWNLCGRPALHGAKDCLRRNAMNDQVSRNESGAPEVNTTRARQGVTGHNVRYVLTFGLIGVVIVFALAYFGVFGA